MSVFGIRSRLKTSIKRLMGGEEDGPSDTTAPNWQNRSPDYLRPREVDAPPAEEPAAEAAPEAPSAEAPEAPAAEAAPADDTAGEPITMEAVQELLDDMVRPALQGDGGDITLLKVEDDSIYVKLVGACSTCPSSIMTMKMGVEALLREEFPHMKDLVQVE